MWIRLPNIPLWMCCTTADVLHHCGCAAPSHQSLASALWSLMPQKLFPTESFLLITAVMVVCREGGPSFHGNVRYCCIVRSSL